MKKISILAISLTALLSCSNDDTQKTCDCNITIATYNEAMQAYEPISETHYSYNCSDYSPTIIQSETELTTALIANQTKTSWLTQKKKKTKSLI